MATVVLELSPDRTRPSPRFEPLHMPTPTDTVHHWIGERLSKEKKSATKAPSTARRTTYDVPPPYEAAGTDTQGSELVDALELNGHGQPAGQQQEGLDSHPSRVGGTGYHRPEIQTCTLRPSTTPRQPSQMQGLFSHRPTSVSRPAEPRVVNPVPRRPAVQAKK